MTVDRPETRNLRFIRLDQVAPNPRNPRGPNVRENDQDSPRSWTVTRAEIEARGYDLKAVNPTAKAPGDMRTPIELLDEIEARGHQVDAAVARLRALLRAGAES